MPRNPFSFISLAPPVSFLLQAIKAALGPLPFFQDEDDVDKGKDDKGKTKDSVDAATPIPTQQASHRPAVLADGSYASQTAITDTVTTSSLSSTAPNIRQATCNFVPVNQIQFHSCSSCNCVPSLVLRSVLLCRSCGFALCVYNVYLPKHLSEVL